MQAKDIIANVEKLAEPIMLENDYELVDVEFVKEGTNWFLRLYVDKEGGFSLDDCELVSRRLEKIIDDKDFIEQAYILEVSSPGIDRVLKKEKEFEKYKGRLVDVKLYKAIDSQKEFQGDLIGLIDGKIVIDIDGEELQFDKKDVATCRLAVQF